jgi:hypothetical protein
MSELSMSIRLANDWVGIQHPQKGANADLPNTDLTPFLPFLYSIDPSIRT